VSREDGRGNRSNSDASHNKDLDPHSIVYASVEAYHNGNDQYWFTVRVELANGVTRTLYRLYEDFYDFHIMLLEEFPVESGRVGEQQRILPFMPIPLQVVNDSVTATRRADLDTYVQDLCRLPRRITQHALVEELFALKEGDKESPPNNNNNNNNGRSSPSVGRTTPSNNMLHSPPPGSPGDRRPSYSHASGPRSHASRSQSSYRYGDESPSGASPSLRSQASFQSSPALGSASTTTNEEMIKVKISFQDDIMAMRIPVSIAFKSLQSKVLERLQTDQGDMSYRDERGNFAKLQSDEDVRDAIDNSGGKLMIYVD
ncbi:bud emergence protein 1, partial [Podila verticillata]